jgi:hypothetical protein
VRRLLVALVLAVAVGLAGPAAPAGAQETEPTNEVPTQDIVPKPNSGRPPEDAGDRGGALQLLVLGLIVGAVGFGAWRLSRQVRSAKAGSPPSG